MFSLATPEFASVDAENEKDDADERGPIGDEHVRSCVMLLAAALGGQTREFRCERAHLAASELELTRQSPRQQEQSDANKC